MRSALVIRCVRSLECNVNEVQFRQRTKDLALRIVRLVGALPRSRAADVIDRRILRSGTSVGANDRAACRTRSSAEFVSKLAVAEEEADETQNWLELLMEGSIVDSRRLDGVADECGQILAMLVRSINTARPGGTGHDPQSKFKIQSPTPKIGIQTAVVA